MTDICALSTTTKNTCLKPVEEIILKDVKENTIEQFKKNTGCSDDLCVLEKAPLDKTDVEKIKAKVFKVPTKSYDHNYWINNTEIDSVMHQLRFLYPGFAHSYIHMIDFKSYSPSNHSIFDYNVPNVQQIDFGKEINLGLQGKAPQQLSTHNDVPLHSFGVVFNTDTSKGSGQHWFVIFISTDIPDPERPNKKMVLIECFNSAGGCPVPASSPEGRMFNEFWNTTALNIAKTTGLKCEFRIITNIEHQSKDTGNCGSYSLFYIYARLNGCVPSEFDNPRRPITDDKMKKFREVCFTINDDADIF